MKRKFPQTCYKSEINYNDIDNEIAHLEMERQSVETEYNVLCNKLQGCLDNKNCNQKEYDRIFVFSVSLEGAKIDCFISMRR
jgi:hypothetical protein